MAVAPKANAITKCALGNCPPNQPVAASRTITATGTRTSARVIIILRDIEEDGLHCDLNTSEEDGGLLIGRHGATLDALQYLTLREQSAGSFAGIDLRADSGRQRIADAVAALARGVYAGADPTPPEPPLTQP